MSSTTRAILRFTLANGVVGFSTLGLVAAAAELRRRHQR
jgi:hypothetical protein